MSVAVSCNLSDGVVLGVDSAVTMQAVGGVAKVYENAEKLFQLGKRPIGVAVFGLGTLGNRSLGSFVREFEVRDPGNVVSADNTVKEVVEGLRKFLFDEYHQLVVPELERATGTPFNQIPREQVPALGMAVGGFSAREYLSEVWQILIPNYATEGSAVQLRARGSLGGNWFALFEPIRRYFKGYDAELLKEVIDYLVGLRGSPLSGPEAQRLQEIVNAREYPVPFAAMPMEEGVQHVRFLVELVINHHRFALGAPLVGGRAKIGKVTYRGERFEIIDSEERRG